MTFYRDVNSISPTTRPTVTDVQAIVQSVRNFIRTRRGERPFNVEFGLNLDDYLFELINDEGALQALNEILIQVPLFEPRVNIDTRKSQVIPDTDNNAFSLVLVFDIVGFEDNGSFEVTASLRQ